MALQPDESQGGWAAIILAGIVTALGVLWKSWFSLRGDMRADRKGEVTNGTWEATIRMLREQLEAERALREEAESEARELRKMLRECMGGGDR